MTNKAIELIQDYLDKKSITQGALAEGIGYSRIAVNVLLNGRMNVTAKFALAFEKYAGVPATKLLYAQADYDLATARAKAAKPKKAKLR